MFAGWSWFAPSQPVASAVVGTGNHNTIVGGNGNNVTVISPPVAGPTVAPPQPIKDGTLPTQQGLTPSRNAVPAQPRPVPKCTPEIIQGGAEAPAHGVTNIGSSIGEQNLAGKDAALNLCSGIDLQNVGPLKGSNAPPLKSAPQKKSDSSAPKRMTDAYGNPCRMIVDEADISFNFSAGPPGSPNPFSPPVGWCFKKLTMTGNRGQPIHAVGIKAQEQNLADNSAPNGELSRDSFVRQAAHQHHEYGIISSLAQDWVRTNGLPSTPEQETAAIAFMNKRLADSNENFRVRSVGAGNVTSYPYITPAK